MNEALEREKITLKAKYKGKNILEIERIRAEISQELSICKGQLATKSDSLTAREKELEILY